MQNLDDTIASAINSLIKYDSLSILSLIIRKSILDKICVSYNNVGSIISRAYYWFSLPIIITVEQRIIGFELFNGMMKYPELFESDLNYPPPEEIKEKLLIELLNAIEKDKFRIMFTEIRGFYKYFLAKKKDKEKFISKILSLGYCIIVKEK